MPSALKTSTISAANPTEAARKAGSAFWMRLASELVDDCYRHEDNNIDGVRFQQSSGARIKDAFLRWIGGLGLIRKPCVNRDIFDHPELNDTYELLEDEKSRETLIGVLAYRILGHRKVRLDLNSPKYWELRRSLDSYIEQRNTLSGIPTLGALHRFNVKGVRLHSHQLVILNTFFLNQYRCPRSGVCVKPGDIVIDAGACWGDTALEFAQDADHVFCFECMPSNIRIIEQNLELNPLLEGKITVVGKALSNRSGQKLLFDDWGPGSRASDTAGMEVETQTIDDFVRENAISQVDFIKMDIEGSEPQALEGAKETLTKYRPELAISVYHDIEHFVSIPKWLNSLDLGYKFYLDHFTIHSEETVLFARAE